MPLSPAQTDSGCDWGRWEGQRGQCKVESQEDEDARNAFIMSGEIYIIYISTDVQFSY